MRIARVALRASMSRCVSCRHGVESRARPQSRRNSRRRGACMFGALYASEGSSIDALVDVAAEFSPRYEVTGPRDVTLDLSGLARLFGSARAIANELQRTAAERDLRVRVAIAGTATAARLLAHGASHDITVIEPGREADAIASLPLALLANVVNENGPNDSNDSNGSNEFA